MSGIESYLSDSNNIFAGVLDEASSEVERRSEPQMVAWKAQQEKANREEIEQLRRKLAEATARLSLSTGGGVSLELRPEPEPEPVPEPEVEEAVPPLSLDR